MAIDFDHINRHVLVPVEDARPLDVQQLRALCRAEETSIRGIVFPGIVNASGLDVLGPGQQTALTLQLINDWQIQFLGSGPVTVTGGNLIGGIDGNPFAPAPGVAIINILSAAAVLVDTEGSGGGVIDPEAVWQHALEGSLSAEDALRLMLAVLAGRTRITSTGEGQAQVAFRDTLDTKDRLTADMVESERVNVTLDPT